MSIAKTTTTAGSGPKPHHHAHHFESAEHEFSAAKLGLWVFLSTEILMFGGLFVGFFIFHGIYPEMFKEGSTFLDWRLGAVNTVVLLLSSFTIATSVYYAQKNNQKAVVLNLAATIALGAVFMMIKYIEYASKIEAGLLPGQLFSYEAAEAANLGLYFSFYFCMTGLHGLHVLIGMGVMAWVLKRAINGEFGPGYYTPIEGIALFWHLVDLIWIYLFPLLYLVE